MGAGRCGNILQYSLLNNKIIDCSMDGKTEEYIHDFRRMTISGELDVCRIIILKIFINRNIEDWRMD